ncbi:MAG: hypothetical protein AAFZ07_19220 [Actinomycetota bacterium]
MIPEPPPSSLVVALRQLADVALLRETLPGLAALDVSAAVSVADQLADVARRLTTSRERLDEAGQALVERAQLALVDGWLTPVVLERLATDPAELGSWLETAAAIDELPSPGPPPGPSTST